PRCLDICILSHSRGPPYPAKGRACVGIEVNRTWMGRAASAAPPLFTRSEHGRDEGARTAVATACHIRWMIPARFDIVRWGHDVWDRLITYNALAAWPEAVRRHRVSRRGRGQHCNSVVEDARWH